MKKCFQSIDRYNKVTMYLSHVEYSNAGEANIFEFVEKDLLPVGVYLHPLLAVRRNHHQHLVTKQGYMSFIP